MRSAVALAGQVLELAVMLRSMKPQQ